MHPSAFHKPTVHVATQPYCLVTADEQGVVLVSPAVQPRLYYSERLVFTDYNEKSYVWSATLTPAQQRTLSTLLQKELDINAPIQHLIVNSGPGFFTVSFAVDPRVLHGQTIVTCMHPGLSVLYVSGLRVAYTFEVKDSVINWPEWVKPPAF